jgi:hypothetical protein
MAAQRKEARRKREEFITTATAHVPTLLVEPRDLRAIERWLREADRTWREGDLGSVEPGAWKKLDARMKAALLPLRDALAAERDRAKAGREALIAEAVALAARATERDSLNQVKAIQAKWQVEAKGAPLAHRDERALWEAFRAACDAVFNARHAKRKEEDERKHGNRRALEEICVQLEALAHATDKDDAEVRRALREAQDQWRKQAGRPDPSTSGIESRFRNAKNTVETTLSARVRSRESAVWQTLAAKERLCEDLDRAVLAGAGAGDGASEAEMQAGWSALPALPAQSESKMVARRDAASRALSDAAAAAEYVARIEKGKVTRHEWLLELEMALKLDTPADLQAYRLALQVKQLKERFSSAASAGVKTPPDLLLSWCAQPGVADARDRQRCERIVAAMAKGG